MTDETHVLCNYDLLLALYVTCQTWYTHIVNMTRNTLYDYTWCGLMLPHSRLTLAQLSVLNVWFKFYTRRLGTCQHTPNKHLSTLTIQFRWKKCCSVLVYYNGKTGGRVWQVSNICRYVVIASVDSAPVNIFSNWPASFHSLYSIISYLKLGNKFRMICTIHFRVRTIHCTHYIMVRCNRRLL